MLTVSSLFKYIIEGLAVSFAVYLMSGQRTTVTETVMLGLTAGITFLVLDLFTAGIGASARQGAGFRIGLSHVGALTGSPSIYSPLATEGFDANPSESLQLPLNQIPYRFPNVSKSDCPQYAVGQSIDDSSHGSGNFLSRWMDWFDNKGTTSGYLNANLNEYKIAHGSYSRYIVQPGYNEGVKGHNITEIEQLSPVMWTTKNPIDQNYALMKEPFLSTRGQMTGGAYENYENPETTRLSGVLYSGDIIDLISGDTIMQRGLVNSQIIFDKPLPNVKTNLSKVRLIHAAQKHDPQKQSPIKYGDPVYIKHNALINNNNQPRFIKYGDRLQSHQDGPLFRVYKLYSKKDQKSQDFVRYGDDILISRGDQTGDNIYLKVESDKSVSSEAAVSDATTYGLSLVRVYELYDKNLCVCPQETLYP